jgi:hypothetical protein
MQDAKEGEAEDAVGGLGRGGAPRAARTNEVKGDWGMRCGGRLGRGVEGWT